LNNKFAKAKDFVQIGIDAEDYYRIKDAKSNERIQLCIRIIGKRPVNNTIIQKCTKMLQ